MDEIQVLALLKQALADAGVSDVKIIRVAALELAVENLAPMPVGAPFSMDGLRERVRVAWGLDYATILNKAAIEYADTTLTAPEVSTEIADNLTV